MRNKMKIFISGPMTGLSNFNYETFDKAASFYRSLGFEVINPTELFNGDQTLPTEKYLKVLLEKLLECDTICMLPNYEFSKGASEELATAVINDLDLIFHESIIKSTIAFIQGVTKTNIV